ncbi:MAG: flagellar basal body protein [Paracoccus sp. (in: a-proteobacteria)]
MSGLTATARGTETVAANMANAMTPGYARRELAVSVQTLGGNGGGVRLDGVTRVVNASLVAESRLAGSASAEAGIRLNFQSAMEKLVGLPGETGALATLLGDFRTALQSASARPDDEIRLGQVVIAADRLTKGLNAASNQVQKSRQMADQAVLLYTENPDEPWMSPESSTVERRTIKMSPPGWKPRRSRAASWSRTPSGAMPRAAPGWSSTISAHGA